MESKLLFTHAEREVIKLVLIGMDNKEIATQLCVVEKTVKFHLVNIYKKAKITREFGHTEYRKRRTLIKFLEEDGFGESHNKQELPAGKYV